MKLIIFLIIFVLSATSTYAKEQTDKEKLSVKERLHKARIEEEKDPRYRQGYNKKTTENISKEKYRKQEPPEDEYEQVEDEDDQDKKFKKDVKRARDRRKTADGLIKDEKLDKLRDLKDKKFNIKTVGSGINKKRSNIIKSRPHIIQY